MLRISQLNPTGRAAVLRLEGRVAGPWVTELRQICELLLSEQSGLELDLSGVSFVDNDGVTALASYRNRGVILSNGQPFVEAQLNLQE